MERVVVTGISGFLGSHLAIKLLQNGYAVRGTVRSLDKEAHVRTVIGRHADVSHLEVVAADLLRHDDWTPVMQGVDYLHHVASPFPRTIPKNEQDIIQPAVEGSLCVLREALRAGVKKAVVTSSIAAVAYGKEGPYRWSTYDEETWTDLSIRKDTTTYIRSKTLAESAIWSFYDNECCGKEMEITTILPGAILGPVLEEDYGTSAAIVLKMLNGQMPLLPQFGFELVDVRDVADLHMRSMHSTACNGERVLATAGYQSMQDIANVLRLAFPDRKVPNRLLPNWLLGVFGLFDKEVKQALVEVKSKRQANSGKARNLLDWQPRSTKEAIITCADSLIAHNLA